MKKSLFVSCIFLLFTLAFHPAHAVSPETCFEIVRAHYLLLETGALNKADQQLDLAAKMCGQTDNDYDKLIKLMEADKEFLALINRVEGMGL